MGSAPTTSQARCKSCGTDEYLYRFDDGLILCDKCRKDAGTAINKVEEFHTLPLPAPWSYHVGRTVASVMGPNREPICKMPFLTHLDRRNADLVIAAPKLFEACKAMMKSIAEEEANGYLKDHTEGFNKAVEQMEYAIHDALHN